MSAFKVRYKCTCKDNNHTMCWIPQKFERSQSTRWELIRLDYIVCMLNSAGNQKPINYCPNCGTKVPEPKKTLDCTNTQIENLQP